jgi:inorganic phosphate transporter, PiT family
VVALVFGLANGLHDAANAIAGPVATRAATPGQALALAAVFHVLGPLLAGTVVANTLAGIVRVPAHQTLAVVGAGLSGALAYNVGTWALGLPVSASHGLVGGLAGAAFAQSGPSGVHWGGLHGLVPVGLVGVLVWLALSPLLAMLVAAVAIRAFRFVLAGAHRRVERSIRRAQWASAAALAFTHGANDAQKTMGVITVMLVASGHLSHFAVPLWVKIVAAGALTIGTSLGGWRVVRTLSSAIYRMGPLSSFVSQSAAAAVVGVAAGIGAPVSTTDVVAPAVIGVGLAQRPRHVRWSVAGRIAWAFVLTVPASGLIAAAFLPLWRLA